MDYSHFTALNLCKPSHLFPKKPFSPLVRMLIVWQIEERIRVRRLIGPKHPTIRWRSGRRQVGRPDAHEG